MIILTFCHRDCWGYNQPMSSASSRYWRLEIFDSAWDCWRLPWTFWLISAQQFAHYCSRSVSWVLCVVAGPPTGSPCSAGPHHRISVWWIRCGWSAHSLVCFDLWLCRWCCFAYCCCLRIVWFRIEQFYWYVVDCWACIYRVNVLLVWSLMRGCWKIRSWEYVCFRRRGI